MNWLKERGTDPPVLSPVEFHPEGVRVVCGLMYIGEPNGPVIGEFWFADDGQIRIELDETCSWPE